MIDRYIDRPNTAFLGGKYKMFDTFCYANFLAHYYILPNTDTVNDSQPTIFQEDLLEKITTVHIIIQQQFHLCHQKKN